MKNNQKEKPGGIRDDSPKPVEGKPGGISDYEAPEYDWDTEENNKPGGVRDD